MLILHGDNQAASRQRLMDLKKVSHRVCECLTLDQIITAVETNSLFGQANTVISEGIFSQRPSSNKKALVEYLEGHPDADIIIWEPKDVSSQIKNFKNVQKFDLPKYIFSLLDHPTISGLHQVLQTMPAEQILASLATRAHKRANIQWLQELLQIDFAQKTSSVPYDLATALELWIAKGLK